jgi:hypothetical protein
MDFSSCSPPTWSIGTLHRGRNSDVRDLQVRVVLLRRPNQIDRGARDCDLYSVDEERAVLDLNVLIVIVISDRDTIKRER